jgi:DDE superfamily endonuclease
MPPPLKPWGSRLVKFSAGGSDGVRVTARWPTAKGVAERPLFPPLDRAIVKAIACEAVAKSGQPLSRQSLADLTRRINESFRVPMSRCTVWRTLHQEAIKPWQHEHWIFPRDPRFAEKAGPILDLYAGRWEGKPLGPKDFVLSSDEKTSIQARQRCHAEVPSRPGQTRRIEPEYKRRGALQYLAVWDVRRGLIMGRCEAKTGIVPFGKLLDQVLDRSPYREAERLFCVVDNGSSHRGDASIRRAKKRDPRIVLVHTPVHASWLNQVEVYFSIIQRKVLTPNDFTDLDEVRTRLALYEELANRTPKPFAWKFTRQKMLEWLQRAAPHFSTAQSA